MYKPLVIKTIRSNGFTSALHAQQYQMALKAILDLLKKVHHVSRENRTTMNERTKIFLIGFLQYGSTGISDP